MLRNSAVSVASVPKMKVGFALKISSKHVLTFFALFQYKKTVWRNSIQKTLW